jgi:hypothetical protein
MSKNQSSNSLNDLKLVGCGILLGWAFYNVQRRLKQKEVPTRSSELAKLSGGELLAQKI